MRPLLEDVFIRDPSAFDYSQNIFMSLNAFRFASQDRRATLLDRHLDTGMNIQIKLFR